MHGLAGRKYVESARISASIVVARRVPLVGCGGDNAMTNGGVQRKRLIDDLEWSILRATRLNVLIEGPRPLVDAVLADLTPHLPQPVSRNSHDVALPPELPAHGTLILHAIGRLSRLEQRSLSTWIERAGDSSRIIATTTTSLFAAVLDGRFDETLYYRLNTMMLPIGMQ
jgi:hypothetical protein